MGFYGADQRGLEYDLLKEFEKYINEEFKKRHLKVRLLVIPTKRGRLLSGLLEGLGDIAAGNLTITPERLKHVVFSDSYFKDVNEIFASGPTPPQIKTVEDLFEKGSHRLFPIQILFDKPDDSL